MRSKLMVAALVFLATPAFAQTQASAAPAQPLSSQDKQFLSTAAEDNHAEIEAALLAETKADNLAVKAFSRLMVDDHTMIASHFALLANAENFDSDWNRRGGAEEPI